MSLAQFNGLVVLQFDDATTGNFQAQAPITVRLTALNTLAPIFSDEIGTPLANPFNSGQLGQFTFWVESGNYNLISNEGTPEEQQLLNVPIIAASDGGLLSFNGRTNVNVIPTANDYTAAQVSYDPDLLPNPLYSGTDTQGAIDKNVEAILFLAGAVTLRGAWDATLNEPNLLDNVLYPKIHGNYWIVDEPGTTALPNYPDGLAPISDWLNLDRVLYLDDSGGTGFERLRPDTAAYLLLTGGTMLGDIIGSNALSFNTVTSNAYVSNIGKTLSGDVLDLNDTPVNGTNRAISTTLNTPVAGQFFVVQTIYAGDISEGVQVAINMLSDFMHFRRKASGVWQAWQQVATESSISSRYLPLTGGTLSGNGRILDIAQLSSGNNCYIGFLNELAEQVGQIGQLSNTTDDISLVAITGKLTVSSPVEINLNAPNVNATGDITAFQGVAAVAQPAIAATGLTTSFELIEHLLDKIEELEARLDAGGL